VKNEAGLGDGAPEPVLHDCTQPHLVSRQPEGARRAGSATTLTGINVGSLSTRVTPSNIAARTRLRHSNSRLRLTPCRSAKAATDTPGRATFSTNAELLLRRKALMARHTADHLANATLQHRPYP
jgi:hypothetical protein